MKNFEKLHIKASLLKCAYEAILQQDKADNFDYDWENHEFKTEIMEGREEHHKIYLEFAEIIANL